MADNNFLQWDESKNNILADVDYENSAVRSGGIPSGTRTAAASNLHNKLFYQLSTMVAALGEMLKGKGYDASDADIATLIAALGNIMTAADMAPYSLTAAMESYVNARIVPVGSIMTWMTETAPSGYLHCNGSSLIRANYAALFNVIGTSYGAVDANHFNLPDLRGYFLRGWDNGRGVDLDRLSRFDRGDGTSGDHVGTKESSANLSHQHPAAANHTHNVPINVGAAGSGGGMYYAQGIRDVWTYTSTPAGAHQHDAQGGSESRPLNINVM